MGIGLSRFRINLYKLWCNKKTINEKYLKENIERELQQREFPDGEKQPTGWEDSRELYEKHIRERTQSKAEMQRIADSYSNVGNEISSLAGAVSKIVDNDSEDPDERRKRIEAEENGSALGTVLGLGIGMLANAVVEMPEQELDYEHEEYKTREEILQEIFGESDYDDEEYDDDEDEGFTMSM